MAEPSVPHHSPLLSTAPGKPLLSLPSALGPTPVFACPWQLQRSVLSFTFYWYLKISKGLPNWKKGSLSKDYPISVPHPKTLSPYPYQWRERGPGGQCLEQCQGTGLTQFSSPAKTESISAWMSWTDSTFEAFYEVLSFWLGFGKRPRAELARRRELKIGRRQEEGQGGKN